MVQGADLYPHLERLSGEAIEVIEVIDGDQAYYAIYTGVERGLPSV